MEYPTLSYEEIDAIVTGIHSDPFAILGPHTHEDGVVIRAFLPLAESAEVMLSSKKSFTMEKVKVDGFFEVVLPDQSMPPAYLLKTTTYDGKVVLYEDSYAFPSTRSEFDAHLLAEGTHMQIYEKLGAHLTELNGSQGVLFAVWAPNALRVSVVGDFNEWDGRRNPMRFHSDNGIWELFVPGLGEGTLYKYEIKTRYQGYMAAKADPVGFFSELRPENASIVWDIGKHKWQDQVWMESRGEKQAANVPISIYEVHLGSWRRKNGWEWLTYEDLANDLIPYVKHMGYTHIELLPIAEHPFDGSWGYQVTGFFAPTSRFGTPDDFMGFIDRCHQEGIGVILDWVPAHYPKDEVGLGFFDGTHLYEHADPRQGAHPDWGTYIFNYARNEVSQFLVSNALFWLDKYHIDGLRVDAVASMLYLDFSREPGQWVPNRFGGRENLDAIDFIRRFNEAVHSYFPEVVTFAEESTSWPGVTHPVSAGGLGFNYKWNMGWMHDTLQYMETDPIYRAFHHGTLTFSLLYAFSEQFVLPFSHDEVVHLKKSMLDKMPGDVWQKFANLRLLYGYKWSHPGKKLQFMGSEFGQWREWNEAQSLDWHLLDQDPKHKGLQILVRDLNHLYASHAALHEEEYSWEGFFWIDLHDSRNSILSYGRRTKNSDDTILIICNFTPVVRMGYRLGVPEAGVYEEILNTDAAEYGGSNVINEPRESSPTPWQDLPHSIMLTVPPVAVVYWKLKSDENHQEEYYSLLFDPVFKDYIWGGRNLKRLFGRSLPPGIIAESWEIAGHEDGTTKVKNGHYAGIPLTTVQDELGLDLIGYRNLWAQERGKFPLLVKLLDANHPLSVQVHPNDDYASANEGNELGKTEMWVVLDATPDAALILGLLPDTSPKLFRQAINSGKLEQNLHRLPVAAGDAKCIPAGTVHAILEGVVIAEIQQNSNTTYRVYDWNRVGADGNPRPLHIYKAIDVIDFANVEPGLAHPVLVYENSWVRRFQLCSNQYFTTERIEMESGAVFQGNCDGATLEIWGILRGRAAIDGMKIEAVQFTLLPAALGEFSIETQAECLFLRTFVP